MGIVILTALCQGASLKGRGALGIGRDGVQLLHFLQQTSTALQGLSKRRSEIVSRAVLSHSCINQGKG